MRKKDIQEKGLHRQHACNTYMHIVLEPQQYLAGIVLVYLYIKQASELRTEILV